jgi:CSLREA domain-containing protein
VLFDAAGGRRRDRAFVIALVVLACALALPSIAAAELLTVDSTADDTDATPGDFTCLTAQGECTLRAAIEEANSSLGESDEIVFAEEVFEGQADDTIDLSSSLPAIIDRGRINGRECPTAAGVGGPCVGVDGPGSGPALSVEGAEEVEIEGLAVTSAQTAIDVAGATFLRVRSSWFGLELDGSAGGNGTGVLVGPGSNNVRIGGEGPEAGNVFVNSAGDGLHVHGARNVRILGNYFGVEKDGATPAANGENVEVTSSEELEAKDVAIGTRVSSAAAASPQCDGGCNLISGAEEGGIDLEGDGGGEAPAVAATIAGNYIGLNATGTAAVPNATSGIRVGRAAQTVIGGPKAGDANRINGGGVGILAGPAATDLVVRGNLIGVGGGGEVLAPPGEGIVVNSEEVPSAALEAAIVNNQIGMEGGAGIVQQGLGATIRGNAVFGAETGIETHGPTEERGNLIEGNSIAGSGASGILVENDLNEILGNEILGAAGGGIWIQGSLLEFGVSGNLVGGDTAAEENVVTGSGGAAIEISNLEATVNEVARNRGTGNGGLFIDLVAASPEEPKGPNNGIGPPAFSTATQAGASGSSAEPSATIRVFRKQLAAAGEVASFLGEATADSAGNWKVVYDSAVPGGTIVAATQTSEAGGTSELATATTVGDGGSADAGAGDGDAASGAGTAGSAGGFFGWIWPRTKLLKTPKRKSRSSVARFEFESDKPGSRFLCRLDEKPFDLCRSPRRFRGLRPGRHVFEVRAIDPAGHLDPTPAKKKFTVLAER